jgi:hypothetical protein
VDRLPNGDWLADFGSQSHYLPGSAIGSPLPSSTGAVFVEVTPSGQVVRTYTFAYAWGVYRVVPIVLKTINDYDGSLRTSPFSINLTTVNDLGGPTDIYYKINNGPTKSVASNGQPYITTQGDNNTLEYWSVDSNGITESPHNSLSGINLQPSASFETLSTATLPTPSSGNSVAILIGAVIVAISVALTVIVLKRRKPN